MSEGKRIFVQLHKPTNNDISIELMADISSIRDEIQNFKDEFSSIGRHTPADTVVCVANALSRIQDNLGRLEEELRAMQLGSRNKTPSKVVKVTNHEPETTMVDIVNAVITDDDFHMGNGNITCASNPDVESIHDLIVKVFTMKTMEDTDSMYS
tara:strand:+ start:1298 stop:1759 length:462 start_codon:yes stop_codon:yes gene_type:complete